ncbi:Phage tail protein [compost metagenome]
MIDIQTIKLLDILPANLRNDPALQAAALAIQNELQVTIEATYKLSIWDRLDRLSSNEVDELAWQLHVDFYNVELPIEQRRGLVKNAIRFHRRKGTPAAVEELVATIFGSGKVEEWFEYGGEPGYFKVTTEDPTATNERAQEFLAAINSVKNVRSWLESIEITKNDDMHLYFSFPSQIGATYTCEQVV